MWPIVFWFRAAAIAAGLIFSGSMANSAEAVPAGKRALLSLNVQISGAGQRAVRSDGTDVKWSTSSNFEASIELVAEKAQTTSAADVKSRNAAAAAYKPSSSMEALQVEAAKCKPGDSACQMAVAMRMMETPEAQNQMQQSEAQQNAPARYQQWEAPTKNGQITIKAADYQEQWDAVFLTASRETRSCKLGLAAGAASVAALSAKDRESLQAGLRSLSVEIDAQTGKSWLLLALGSYAQGELRCRINDGGKVSDEREARGIVFKVPLDSEASGGWVAGSTVSGGALARGEMKFDSKPAARSLTGMMSVTAPLKVTVRWELKPL